MRSASHFTLTACVCVVVGCHLHQPPGGLRVYVCGAIVCALHQVDVTAAAAPAAAAGVTPGVMPDQAAASTQMVGMAVKQLTAGWGVTGDVWASIHAGVARLKPHKAHVRRPPLQCGLGFCVDARERGVWLHCRICTAPCRWRGHPVLAVNSYELLLLQAAYAARQDVGCAALRSVEQRAGRLALSHFRRVKQLGTGDVGLVDLVELQQGGSRCVLHYSV